MKWNGLKRSSNVEDIRASGSVGSGRISSGMLINIVKILLGTKIGRIVFVIGAIAYFMGYNPLAFLDMTSASTQNTKVELSQKDETNAQFVSAVLAQTEEIWHQQFLLLKAEYKEPKLVLFRGSVNSACGFASAQIGPFYCPVDKKVYLDLGFFDELKLRHNAPGDFAQAYVIAHEIGHHVQNLVGTLKKSNQQKSVSDTKEANGVQVKVELQADCYAGIWAYHVNKKGTIIEKGDIEEALNAASAIGDDTLQKQAKGYVTPDSFTHGSSKQRMKWFTLGFNSGNIAACNTGI